MSKTIAVEISRLNKTYGNGFCAIKDLSLEIQEGEFFGLLGQNGAGKSTLINSLAGLVKPTSGYVRIMGNDIRDNRTNAAMSVGIVPQEIVCDPFLTVAETLVFQSGFFGLRNNEAWLDTIVSKLGLEDKISTPVRMLSGGMKRRVLIAQALVHKPPVIVLDEPTAGVDVQLRRELWAFIGQLHREGHTIILTTHYLEEAQNLCSRIAIMNAGEIIALDKTDALLAKAQENTVRFRLPCTLPDVLQSQVLQNQAGRYVLRYTDLQNLTMILKSLNDLGVEPENLSIERAGLEEVFTELLNKN